MIHEKREKMFHRKVQLPAVYRFYVGYDGLPAWKMGIVIAYTWLD